MLLLLSKQQLHHLWLQDQFNTAWSHPC
jgi:hypothetical protein